MYNVEKYIEQISEKRLSSPAVMSVYRKNIGGITFKLRGREFYQKSILHYKALKNFSGRNMTTY